MNRKQRRIEKSQGEKTPSRQSDLQAALSVHREGKLTQAQALYDAILKTDPQNFDALHYSGTIAYQLKNPQKAINLINEAIRINPGSAQAHYNLGVILHEFKQPDAALACFNQAIALNPNFAEAYSNRGVILKELQQLDAALASYDKAIMLKPDYAEAYSNKGTILREFKQLDAALACFNQAIAFNPAFAEAYSNRGVILKEFQQLDAALANYDKAIALKPDYADAYCNRGVLLQEIGQLEKAIADYNKAIAIAPDYANAHLYKSLILLLVGNFDEGWQEHEWRWKVTKFRRKSFSQPLWLGKESLAGKTILLHKEQGLGDTIQFCRYAAMVVKLGAKVILEVQEPLLNLFSDLNGLVQLVKEGGFLPEFDYYCPLMSLPLAFKTNLHNIPVPANYLNSSLKKIEQWQVILGAKTKPRIGIVWRGNTEHVKDYSRSIPLSDLINQLPDGFHYVSLQKEINEKDLQTLQTHPEVLHFGSGLEDFTDTAALCELMDVVISVDTSVAHLSAALGRPTWILLSYVPDWRWLMDREDSPWYPTVRLFRQTFYGDWKSVIARVRTELGGLSHE